VRVPVAPGSPQVGITDKRELQKRVILAAKLTKVVDGYALTSVLNTNEAEKAQEPVVELDEIEPQWENCGRVEFESVDREEDIQSQLRLGHLNPEERKSLIEACSDR